MPQTTIIRGGRVIDADKGSAQAADILIEDDTLRAIGPPGLDAPEGARVVTADRRLLMPGLVNAHTHSHGNLPRSMGDRWTLELALNGNIAAREHFTLEDKRLAAQLGAVEMVLKGCTACYDLVYEFPNPSVEGLNAVAEGYESVGMRAVVAPMMADGTFYEAVPGLLEALPDDLRRELEGKPRSRRWQGAIDIAREALEQWRFEPDQVRLAMAPTIPAHCSNEFLQGLATLTREHGLGLHTHLAESKVQAIAGLRRFGKSLTAHLEDLGVLGENFTAAHGVWLDDEDMARLAGSGSKIAHNPASNMRYGSGTARVRRMLDTDLVVGVGTDSRSCSDNLNMFEAMRLASYTSRIQGPDYRQWLTTDEVFRMATSHSARALGMHDQIGRLAPGYKADIVFLDAAHPNYVPLTNVLHQVVNAEDGTGVRDVMIGGRMVVKDRRLTTVDYPSLLANAEAAWERLRTKTSTSYVLRQKLEEIVGSFCVGLANSPHHLHRYVG